MRTLEDLYVECATALDFPSYFGGNWPAFAECLSDLDWLDLTNGVVLLVIRADQVLRDNPSEVTTFLKVIDQATTVLERPLDPAEPWGRPSSSLTIIFQANAARDVPFLPPFPMLEFDAANASNALDTLLPPSALE